MQRPPFLRARLLALSVFLATGLMNAAAHADPPPYKIGMSVGLVGYAATVDAAWRDGVQLAVDHLNAEGGIGGRKIAVVIEDNHSLPQDAVVAYRKMIENDHVDIFLSGCVSAGNIAAAPIVVRAETPMLLCSILPSAPDQVKWAFSTLPPAQFEIETRLQYLRDHTSIRKFGVLHDPSPYALLQARAAVAEAAQYGLTLTSNESYQQNDLDLGVQLGQINATGAGAVLKIGLGGSTLTAAKNLRQNNLPQIMLTSLEDVAVFRPVAQVLGDRFFFVASPSQVYETLPAGALKAAIGEFLAPWRARYGDRDPNWASRGWDAVMLTATAAKQAPTLKGPDMRAALEQIDGFQGTTGVYHFSASNHYGITENPLVLAQIIDGKTELAK